MIAEIIPHDKVHLEYTKTYLAIKYPHNSSEKIETIVDLSCELKLDILIEEFDVHGYIIYLKIGDYVINSACDCYKVDGGDVGYDLILERPRKYLPIKESVIEFQQNLKESRKI
jgi:hypothetical protein